MPQVVRCQVILNPTADPRDQIMNTWHCVTVGAASSADAADEFATDLESFYLTVDSQFSNELSGVSALFRAFDLSDPKPRQPVLEQSFTNFTTSTDRGARELCICLSYKGIYLSGISPKSKRGRIYLGPLTRGAVDSTDGFFTAATVAVFTGAASTLQTASAANAEYRWVIYSPTLDPAGEGTDVASWDAVQEGWVDDNPAIQRRRSSTTHNKAAWS